MHFIEKLEREILTRSILGYRKARNFRDIKFRGSPEINIARIAKICNFREINFHGIATWRNLAIVTVQTFCLRYTCTFNDLVFFTCNWMLLT